MTSLSEIPKLAAIPRVTSLLEIPELPTGDITFGNSRAYGNPMGDITLGFSAAYSRGRFLSFVMNNFAFPVFVVLNLTLACQCGMFWFH